MPREAETRETEAEQGQRAGFGDRSGHHRCEGDAALEVDRLRWQLHSLAPEQTVEHIKKWLPQIAGSRRFQFGRIDIEIWADDTFESAGGTRLQISFKGSTVDANSAEGIRRP